MTDSSPIRLRRALTTTPLSRQHERRRRSERGAPRIPWTAFDARKYDAPSLALATEAMTALARGEYTAVDSFARLSSTLAQNGAPLDLVSASAEIPADEVRHADYALRMATILAGEEVSVDFDRSLFGPPWAPASTTEALDVLMLELPAISE